MCLFILLLLLFFFLFLLNTGTTRSVSLTLILIVRRLWLSGLLTGSLTEPLGQLGWMENFVLKQSEDILPLKLTLGPARPLVHLLLPAFLQELRVEDVPASLVEFPPVIVGPGVRPPLVLGVHSDLGRIFPSQSSAMRYLISVSTYTSLTLILQYCIFLSSSGLYLLRIKSQFDGLLLILLSLSLFQFFELK